MNGTLNKHLAEIDITATERINKIIKETNQLLWVGLMNNYKHSAEKIVYNEIIFAWYLKFSFKTVSRRTRNGLNKLS